jgi:hypothetical protein
MDGHHRLSPIVGKRRARPQRFLEAVFFQNISRKEDSEGGLYPCDTARQEKHGRRETPGASRPSCRATGVAGATNVAPLDGNKPLIASTAEE